MQAPFLAVACSSPSSWGEAKDHRIAHFAQRGNTPPSSPLKT
jgi:hypothetical protein